MLKISTAVVQLLIMTTKKWILTSNNQLLCQYIFAWWAYFPLKLGACFPWLIITTSKRQIKVLENIFLNVMYLTISSCSKVIAFRLILSFRDTFSERKC